MRITFKVFSLIILTVVVAISGTGVAAQKKSKFVTVSGTNFIAPDGSKMMLRGINLGTWLLPEGYMFEFKKASSPEKIYLMVNELLGEAKARAFWKEFRDHYITHEDIKFIKRAGFNHVRIPFNYRMFVNRDDPSRLEGIGYELLERVVGWCKQEGLYVIFDMHAAPGGQTGDNIDDSMGYPHLFENEEDQELTVRIWAKLAKQYANEPIVIGYDLLNEPIAHYFDIEALNPKLEPLYKRIVAAMRKYDKNHIMFIGGAQWNQNFKIFGPPWENKLSYTFHRYWMPAEQKAFDEFVEFGKKNNVPMYLGETGENTDEWIDAFRKLSEKNDIGWCFWTYKRLETTRSVVSIPKPKDWGEIVKFADSPRGGFDDMRKIKPKKELVERVLREYLDNIRLAKCRVNENYLKALGLVRQT